VSKKRRRDNQVPARRPRNPILVPAAIAVGVVIAVAAGIFLTQARPTTATAWSRLGTEDVHSLSFVEGDLDHLLFGHHGGLAETRDGGRTWQPLPTGDDAMAMQPAADGSIVIAGHEVFTASQDGGQTWEPIAADLPSLDIHGFARDPANPARMWAYLATGGLWESTDAGAHWTRVREDNVLFPLAISVGGATRLLGLDAGGLVASEDGGRTWAQLGTPPTTPMTAFAGTSDGTVLYAGSPDGLFRSDDSGRTWAATSFSGSPFAIATSPDGSTVAVVTRMTEFFRSPDRGVSWPGPTS
jgi:photosystem II stability/assembly factor-like uncharacterized protein